MPREFDIESASKAFVADQLGEDETQILRRTLSTYAYQNLKHERFVVRNAELIKQAKGSDNLVARMLALLVEKPLSH